MRGLVVAVISLMVVTAASTAPAFGQAGGTMTCISLSGAMDETMQVQITGRQAAVTIGQRQARGTVITDDLSYQIALPNTQHVSINRNTGAAIWISSEPRGAIQYRCRPGAQRL